MSRQKLIHIHSKRPNQAPTKEQLELGEIAVNYSDGTEKLYIKNASDQVVGFINEKEAVGKKTAEGGEIFNYYDDRNSDPENKATGSYSHAEGYSTVASGEASHAEGGTYMNGGAGQYAYVVASGDYSHAEGAGTKASGIGSHAEGFAYEDWNESLHETVASGNGSHAEGGGSIASGEFSHAEGLKTQAKNQGEHSCGKFNLSTENTGGPGTLFSIGYGTDDTDRRNAVEVKNDGSSYFNETAKFKNNVELTGNDCNLTLYGNNSKISLDDDAFIGFNQNYDLEISCLNEIKIAPSMTTTLDSDAVITGDLRLKSTINFGNKLNFGDGDYCNLNEDRDDHLEIYARNGISLNTGTFEANVTVNNNLVEINNFAVGINSTSTYKELTSNDKVLITNGKSQFRLPKNPKNGQQYLFIKIYWDYIYISVPSGTSARIVSTGGGSNGPATYSTYQNTNGGSDNGGRLIHVVYSSERNVWYLQSMKTLWV